MKKRAVSIFLIIVMIFTVIGTVYAEKLDITDKVINKLLQFSAEDRKSLYTIIKPMIISDSGLDVIVSLINDYDSKSNSMFNDMIGSLLNYTDKDTAINAVRGIKLIDENIRRKYANLFEKRETLQLSPEAMQSVQYFITQACNEHKKLETLLRDDGITAGVIAKMLEVIAGINAGKPLLTENLNKKEDFEFYTVSTVLKNKADFDVYLKKINTKYTTEEKLKIKQIGQEIGFFTPAKEVVSSNLRNGIGYQKNDLSIKYNVIHDKAVIPGVYAEGAEVIEAALYIDDVKQEFGSLDREYTIKIPVISGNIMVYKIKDSLLPIKYSVCIDGELFIRIDETGYYGIKHVPKYFDDASGWGSSYIESLYNRGIINGKADNIFAPGDSITREEFVKLIVELFGFDDDKYYTNFADVNKEEWYYKYVAVAYKNGIINGVGDNLFGVGDNITRQDICKIISNIIEKKNISLLPQKADCLFADSNEIASYAKESVDIMYKSGIVSGDENGYFYPQNNATREEAAKIIHGVLELYIKDALD